ncbi:MAG: hypothetical protein HY286_05610 [Planctomycetes bacterium]|nr:hypothetical protein [Planctomycetota bacterium]
MRDLTLEFSLILIFATAPLARAQNPPVSKPAEVEEHYPGGALLRRFGVDEQGRRNGPFSEWYESGKMKVRTSYRAGDLEGAFDELHPDGSVKIRAYYNKNLLTASYYEKSEDGAREIKAAFKDGKKHGKVEVFEKHKQISIQDWKNGDLLEIDGIAPYPKSRDAIRDELSKIQDLPPQSGFDKSDPRLLALRHLQQYRYLCEVPWEGMLLDAHMNDATKWAAKILKAIGRLDHTPKNPGWPADEYKKAYEGTSHSNLSAGTDLPRSVDSYMDDSDPSNIDRVGHRRWCLNPTMLKTGFGADGPWSAMWSMDASRGKANAGEFVAYPARGYFPKEYFHSGAACSFGGISGKVTARDKDKTKIRVLRLDEWYAQEGEPLPIDYINVSKEGFGTANCLIFRAKGMQNTPGTCYMVEISVDGDDNPEVKYLVEFFELAKKSEPPSK